MNNGGIVWIRKQVEGTFIEENDSLRSEYCDFIEQKATGASAPHVTNRGTHFSVVGSTFDGFQESNKITCMGELGGQGNRVRIRFGVQQYMRVHRKTVINQRPPIIRIIEIHP